MSGRFEGLTKIPQEPAVRLLARTNLALETDLAGPATSAVPEVLSELEASEATVDMLRLMAASLPGRECTWWACLAARDLLGPGVEPTPSLKAAEAWVFRPGEETRETAFRAAEAAGPMDDTAMCATIAVYSGGSLGPGDLKEYPAPEGAAAAMALGMNVMAAAKIAEGDLMGALDHLLDRALDIARGGNGRVERAVRAEEDKAAETAGEDSGE